MCVYLDYNASTPIHPKVLDYMIDIYKNHYGNADSRTHTWGNEAREIVERARRQIASLFSVETHEVVFTSGATESDNMGILGMAKWGKEVGKSHIITTAIEHKAILEPLHILEGQGFNIDYLLPDRDGKISLQQVINHIKPETLMVCIMHANNETGVIQPVEEIGDYLNKMKIYFLIDAAQTSGKLVRQIQNLKYDLLSVSAHKMHGPQGVGAIIIKKREFVSPPIQPILFGGGQENGLRPGTLPVALIGGFGVAAEIAQNINQEWYDKTSKMKHKILKLLNESNIRFIINGDQNRCLPNTLNVSFPTVDSEALMIALKDQCAISNGSACTSKNYNLSYVLSAMKIEKDIIQSSVRLSWDIEDILPSIKNIISLVLDLQHEKGG